MSFKQNFLQKIKIDKLTRKVLNSIGPPDSGRKVDKEAMRGLLEMRSYQYRHERDLDLYILNDETGAEKILVLDNELAIYKTTVEDVALRKSPTVKEMINIRNVIKILGDSGVVLSKREESVKSIRRESIDKLDLSFEASDIENLAAEGVLALESGNAEGVLDCLLLFSELLGYQPPPKPLEIPDYQVYGLPGTRPSGEKMYGPMVMYNRSNNMLKLISEAIRISDDEQIEFVHAVARGKEKGAAEGPGIFEFLKEAVVKQNIWDAALI